MAKYISHYATGKQATNHKYYERVPVGSKNGHTTYRYFYTKEEYDIYICDL